MASNFDEGMLKYQAYIQSLERGEEAFGVEILWVVAQVLECKVQISFEKGGLIIYGTSYADYRISLQLVVNAKGIIENVAQRDDCLTNLHDSKIQVQNQGSIKKVKEITTFDEIFEVIEVGNDDMSLKEALEEMLTEEQEQTSDEVIRAVNRTTFPGIENSGPGPRSYMKQNIFLND